MKSSKTTRRALLGSLTSLVLCFAMLIGSTFAWFTDSASTSVNKIEAGTLDVQLLLKADEQGEYVNIGDEKTPIFGTGSLAQNNNAATLWEPGKTQVAYLAIKNNGNLDLQYKVCLNVQNVSKNLYQVMKYAITPDAQFGSVTSWTQGNSVVVGAQDVSQSVKLEAGGTHYFALSIHMDETADNEYQGGQANFDLTVYATQIASESDSFGNQYDANAEYDVLDTWTGTTEGGTQTEPSQDQQPTLSDGKYHIDSAAEFINYINAVVTSTGNRYDMSEAVLDKSIDLNGYTFTRTGQAYMFSGKFDGQGHTVSNFKVTRTDGSDSDATLYTGLFGYLSGTSCYVKNLTVKNATVTSGGGQVAVIAPSVNDGATVDNCHAINCTVSGLKKVGAVVGYAQGTSSTVSNCSAKDCTVLVSRDNSAECTLFGFDNGATFTGNVDKGGNSTLYGITGNVAAVSNATELKAAFTAMTSQRDSTTVVLTSDIDMTGYTSYNANYRTITIIGNGHTLKNQTKPLFDRAAPGNITVSDVTFKNANINENYDIDSWSTGDGPRSAGVVLGEFDNNGGGTIKIEDCKVVDSAVKAWKWAGAFVGFVNGNQSTNESWVKFENCAVTNTTVSTKDSSAGSLVGHTYVDTTITNCTVSGNSSVGCAENREGGAAKAGWFVGTVNGGTTQFSGTNSVNVNTGCELGNVNAAAAANGGFVGRVAGGTVTIA